MKSVGGMGSSRRMRSRWVLLVAALAMLCVAACGSGDKTSASSAAGSNAAAANGPIAAAANGSEPASPGTGQISAADVTPSDALPADKTGGFDGAKAYEYTAKLVSFGPRPPNSDAIHKTQDYLMAQLKGYGCAVDTDDFHSSTPIGEVPMKNIIAKIPGKTNDLIVLLTHYDTLRKDGFVGAVDGGSSTGLMLEMASLLCGKTEKQPLGVWIAFLDGEEAFEQWSDTDSVYGSRELAARMAMAGDLPRVKAVILADMVGPKNLVIRRESNSMGWLVSLVWSTAARLGYSNIFINDERAIEDDHLPFMKRHVASVDIIDLIDYQNAGYWHTDQDTMDKVSARSLGIVGHVILATMQDLQSRHGQH
jgi:glutaminyl-peptide cyclotransferase